MLQQIVPKIQEIAPKIAAWLFPGAYMMCQLRGKKLQIITLLVAVYFSIKLVRKRSTKKALRKKCDTKRKACREALDQLAGRVERSGITDDHMNMVCELSVSELGSKLHSGELKALDVLRAYQMKALLVNKKTNAILDVVSEAEVTALECDQMEDTQGRLLHGIPISIKDNFCMTGYDSIIGVASFIGKPQDKDSVLVKVLKKQGAIPFVRTNVPQTMMSYDTSSPLFGQTYNPHGKGRCAGGSSGGEGALIGGGGSPLGLGGDIGGSIRIPASMCGICGFKPTMSRLSTRDCNGIFKGQNIIKSAYGPMAHDVDSLVLMMRALLCDYHFELDKSIPPIPFNEEVYSQTKKLKIGFYIHDDFMTPVPCMQRAVHIAVQALRDQGHEVVPWKFPKLGRLGATYWSKAMFGDRGQRVLSFIKDEPYDHSFGEIKRLLTMNKVLLKFIIFLTRWLQPTIAATLPGTLGISSVFEWQQLVRDIADFRQEVEENLKANHVDVLLSPAFGIPAPLVGQHRMCSGAASYTTVVNVLDFPAGTLPVTKVTYEDVANMADYPVPDLWHRTAKNSMVGAEGLPVGVQVIGLPWQEETTLRIMKELETALKK